MGTYRSALAPVFPTRSLPARSTSDNFPEMVCTAATAAAGVDACNTRSKHAPAIGVHRTCFVDLSNELMMTPKMR
jgi:hypothetical protein